VKQSDSEHGGRAETRRKVSYLKTPGLGRGAEARVWLRSRAVEGEKRRLGREKGL
jgi:hypothetical protein